MSNNMKQQLKGMKESICKLEQALSDSEQFIRYTSDPKEKNRMLNSIKKILGLIQDQSELYNLAWEDLSRLTKIDSSDQTDKEDIEKIIKHVKKLENNSNLIPKRSANSKDIQVMYKVIKNKIDDKKLTLICDKLGIKWQEWDKKDVEPRLQILVEVIQQSRMGELIDLVSDLT